MFWNKNILGPLCMLLWQVYELPIILANNNKFQDCFSWLQKTNKRRICLRKYWWYFWQLSFSPSLPLRAVRFIRKTFWGGVGGILLTENPNFFYTINFQFQWNNLKDGRKKIWSYNIIHTNFTALCPYSTCKRWCSHP